MRKTDRSDSQHQASPLTAHRGGSRLWYASKDPSKEKCGKPCRGTVGLEFVDTDLGGRMHVPTRLGEQRRNMAVGSNITPNRAGSD